MAGSLFPTNNPFRASGLPPVVRSWYDGRSQPPPEPDAPEVAPQSALPVHERMDVGIPDAYRQGDTSKGYFYRPVQGSFDIITARAYSSYDSYGRALVESIVANVVGAGGITVDFGDPDLNERFLAWRPNLTRPYEHFDMMQRSVVRRLVRDGEALDQFLWRRDGLYLQEIDALDLPLTRLLDPPGARIRPGSIINGIELTEDRVAVAYHFRPFYNTFPGYQSRVLPASVVVHTYTTQYPYQIRGNSWMRGAIEPLRLLRQYECDYVEQMSIAAMAPGFFTWDPNVLGELATLAESSTEEQRLEHIKAFVGRMASADPKTRMAFPLGIDWKSMNYPNVLGGDTYESIKKGLLGRIGEAMGLTYYTVAGIFEATSFSSSRAARLEDIATYREIQKVLQEFVERVAEEWLTWQRLTDRSVGARTFTIEYTPPDFGFIDPVREVTAHEREVALGTRSRTEIIEESGRRAPYVFETLAAEMADMDRRLKAHGLPPKYGNPAT